VTTNYILHNTQLKTARIQLSNVFCPPIKHWQTSGYFT